jgi:hypothetical protein
VTGETKTILGFDMAPPEIPTNEKSDGWLFLQNTLEFYSTCMPKFFLRLWNLENPYLMSIYEELT